MAQPKGSQAWVVRVRAQTETGHLGSRRQLVGRQTLETVFQTGLLPGPLSQFPSSSGYMLVATGWGSSGTEVPGCLRAVLYSINPFLVSMV